MFGPSPSGFARDRDKKRYSWCLFLQSLRLVTLNSKAFT